MKVLAVNSSPRRGGQSRTELMLDRLVIGMREAGAEVDLVHLRDKKIGYCLCCYTCASKTPGQCLQNDDMTNELFPKFLAADLVVLGTPLFHFTLTASMKTFVERTFPIMEPFLVRNERGIYDHVMRFKSPDIAVLSVAAFPHKVVFSELSHYVNHLWGPNGVGGGRLVAEIYRTSSQAMTQLSCDRLDDILTATEQGGRELVQNLNISPDTMARIQQPMSDLRSGLGFTNMYWHACIEDQIVPKTLENRGDLPRPRTIDEMIVLMRLGFNYEAASGHAAVLQFGFTGEPSGTCHFTIENGAIQGTAGPAEQPDLTIIVAASVWVGVLAGKIELGAMLVSEGFALEGDASLLPRLSRWFFRGFSAT